MSSSLSVPIPIPIAVDSASCVTVAQMALFKPLKHRHLVRGRVRVRPLHRRLDSVTPLRCSSAGDDAVITLHVGGMMCEGCASSVKKILESRPQVLSAHVNLTSETAIVSPAPEQKTAPNYLKQLGEELAQHLTTCGFTSTLRGMGSRFSTYSLFHFVFVVVLFCKCHCICFYEFFCNIEER
ncbi:Copper-transporting ATPase PAA1 [Spatholobus suberectus]|nr:Copper-transporting ATPase PAA1 [Spatholobus suberectus]